MASDDQIRQLVENDFESYYSTYAAGSFAAQVWTNNAWIAALCIASGVLGLPVLWILLPERAQRRRGRRPDGQPATGSTCSSG